MQTAAACDWSRDTAAARAEHVATAQQHLDASAAAAAGQVAELRGMAPILYQRLAHCAKQLSFQRKHAIKRSEGGRSAVAAHVTHLLAVARYCEQVAASTDALTSDLLSAAICAHNCVGVVRSRPPTSQRCRADGLGRLKGTLHDFSVLAVCANQCDCTILL